jgi:glutathione peroxidase
MSKIFIAAAGLLILTGALRAETESAKPATTTMIADKTLADYSDPRHIPFATISGDTTTLAAYDGKVVLIVNVASECGLTPQYAGLEELYRRFKDSGLIVIGFPANDFNAQEPGTNEEILNFCTSKFDVTFPMMSKVTVKGKEKHPLFLALTEKSNMAGEIRWNFSKFLLDRHGNLIARFDPTIKPDSEQLLAAIRQTLRP